MMSGEPFDEERADELLEEAAARAASGDVSGAGAFALDAAALLPAGDDRYDTLRLAAQLLTRAEQHSRAADAWAAAADDAADDTTRAHDLSSEGEAARRCGDWQRSARALEAALALVEGALGESVEFGVVAQNLAVTYKYIGRFGDAERLYRRALSIAEAAGDDGLIATICHNLGGVAHARGDAQAGLVWARRAVAMREELDNEIALAGDRGALAGLLIDLGEFDEATRLLDAARATFAAHHDRLEVAIIDGSLARIALRSGALPDAERYAMAALAGKEAVLGPTSPDLAVTLTTLGAIRRKQGAAKAAVSLHQRARDVLRPHVEPSHPLLRTIDDNLATAKAAARSRTRPVSRSGLCDG